jgi:hypothetical protein
MVCPPAPMQQSCTVDGNAGSRCLSTFKPQCDSC